MSNRINPIYWERTSNEAVQIIDIRTLPEDVKTAIILAGTAIAKAFDAGDFAAVKPDSYAYASLIELSDVVNNMHSFMHEVPSLVPAPF